MARNRDYLVEPDLVLHVYNWAVDGRDLFLRKSDFQLFLRLLLECQKRYPVSVLQYTLLPKGFDLLLHQHKPFALSHFMKKLCHTYALLLNRRLKRKGLLFDGRFRGVPVHDGGELLLLSYTLHTSPAEIGLVRDREPWPYSSYTSYISNQGKCLSDPSLILALVGGPVQYARFLEHFDPADPGSVENFLCPESATIWAKKRKKRR